MKVGLTGLSGLRQDDGVRRADALRAAPGERRAQIGTIKVPDARIDALAKIHSPKKVTLSEVTFVDFPPPLNATQKAVLDQEMVTALRDADALVQVVRGFPTWPGTAATPADDVRAFSTELALADLGQVEKKVERMKKEKGNERELALFERLQQILEEGKPLRTTSFTADEQNLLAGYAFLSLRPLLVVVNVPESDVAKPVPEDVAAAAREGGAEAFVLSAAVEAEVAELDAAIARRSSRTWV
jgi:ribosome-binding ATPase YchF (GTP1/OBG family)